MSTAVLQLLDDLSPLPNAPSPDYMEHYGIMPLRVVDGRLMLGTWRDETDIQVIDDYAVRYDAPAELLRFPEPMLRAAIRRLYGSDGLSAEQLIAELEPAEFVEPRRLDIAIDDMRAQANEAPVVRLVNLLLLEALDARASDVHLESQKNALKVRYRIDGVLQDAPNPPASMREPMISRLKIMAELDIAERRVPQDGRIRLRLQDRDVDVRVSTLPTLHGESVVLRLLDKQRGRIGLEQLGFGPAHLDELLRRLNRPHGMVLVTGPTGSGKTTTLYAAIDAVRTGREKILTVEDPVEYDLPGANQVQIAPKVGLTFASALRALLRQDPDVLLVGEIRDSETAEIATHAALTGHLVLSTLHTNDAVSAVSRLIDLGVDDYLIAGTLEAVIAQRLVRRVCDECARHVNITESEATALGCERSEHFEYAMGSGCAHCRGTGYRGRIGIYELLTIDDELRDRITETKNVRVLRQQAISTGMQTLLNDGLAKIKQRLTTPSEVLQAVAVS
jgi:type II secretory ATPase GspE/PulE/Tfp pilus assembly ATPase PilB-like protein